MSYSNSLVNGLSVCELLALPPAKRITLIKRLRQAEGKLKFASRYSHRKIMFNMMRDAIRTLSSLKIKLEGLKLETQMAESPQETESVLKAYSQELIDSVEEQLKDKTVLNIPKSNEPVKPIDELQVAIFDFHANKKLKNTQPVIKSLTEALTELTSLQYKSLTHCGCCQRQWDEFRRTTVTALCCDNPNYTPWVESVVVVPQIKSKPKTGNKSLTTIFGERTKELQQFLVIQEELTAIGAKVGKLINSRSDAKGWNLTWGKDRAGLFWTPADGWDIESLKYDTELTGNWEGFDLMEHLVSNDIDLEEVLDTDTEPQMINYPLNEPLPIFVEKPKTEHLANDGWLQSLMAIPVPSTSKGTYYTLYFDKEKICLGGLAPVGTAWIYSGKDYCTFQQVWLPDNYNPVGKLLDVLKAIPKPGMAASTKEQREQFKREGEALAIIRRRGRPKKEIGESKVSKSKSVPKTHTTWTGTVQYVDLVDGKSFDFAKDNSDKFAFKRLRVELKTNHGETIQFWTPNTEIRLTRNLKRVPGVSMITSVIDADDWIKSVPAPENYSAGWSNMPVPTLKAGDLITVSGKVKSSWRGATVINWVRLQEVIPQNGNKIVASPKLKNQAPGSSKSITPYKGEQLNLILV